MMQKKYSVWIFLLCLLLLSSCSGKQKKMLEDVNALLIEPTLVSENDMLQIKSLYNIPEPQRKIAVLFGYGYNDKAFIDIVLDQIKKTVGLSANGGAVFPLVFPNDFKWGASARISLLTGMLEDAQVNGLVLVGVPEGTHSVLASLQDAGGGTIPYPVVSLLPQDDILGMEAGCDLVLEYLPVAASDDELSEESSIYVENMPELIVRTIRYLSLVPTDHIGGFEKDMTELMIHARQMVGSRWTVARYNDPETGIRPENHFIIENKSKGMQ